MKPGQILLFVGVAMLAMTACSGHTEPRVGGWRIENDSDHVILVVQGLDFERALERGYHSGYPFERGQEYRMPLFRKQDDGSWCNAANRNLWILGSRTNPANREDFPLPDDPTTPLDPDDLIILEHIEGPYCFEDGEIYTFTG